MLVPTVVIPLRMLFQPEKRFVLVCKLKFPAAVGQETRDVFAFTSSMLKTGRLVCRATLVTNTPKNELL